MFNDKELGDMFLSKHPYWTEYSMNVLSDKGNMTLSWDSKYLFDLAYYASCQIGINPFLLQEFFKQHEIKRQHEWTRNENLEIYKLSDHSKVLDIGCGIGVNAMLMHQYNPTWNISLLDGHSWKGQIGKTVEYLDGYNEEYVFYNNWDITKNCLKKTQADESKFTFLDEDSEWEMYDLIMSTWSYAHHYPLDTYWDKVLKHLNLGGTLLLDVYNEEDIKRVSDSLGCNPTIHTRQNMNRCVWKTEQLNYG